MPALNRSFSFVLYRIIPNNLVLIIYVTPINGFSYRFD
jgi:hypothetical protein